MLGYTAETRKVAGDLTVSVVHPKAGHSLKYSVRDLDGIMAGMRVEVQPLLVTEQPLCIVSYEAGGAERSFEVGPIVLDAAGFDTAAPVFGKDYKRPKDTPREKARKELETPETLQAATGAAHRFIQPKNPFLSQTEGGPVSVAETVRVSEILISATEAAKRYNAETGGIPEGFIGQLRKEYPDGGSHNICERAARKMAEGEQTGEGLVRGGGSQWRRRNRIRKFCAPRRVQSGGGSTNKNGINTSIRSKLCWH
jgi:hypothetical protein